jgi:hypothetical protein
VRRFAGAALSTAFVAGLVIVSTAGPAAAHVCATAQQIPVGRPGTIQVAVTVEGHVVPTVDVTLPAGLTLDRVDAKAGWKTTRDGSTIHYAGGPILAYTCEYFSLGVTATTRGSYPIRVVQRDENGQTVADTTAGTSADPALQVVYAGVTPPSPPGSGGGLSATTMIGIGFLAVGALLVGFLGFRAWRGRGYDDEDDDEDSEAGNDDREDELRERVAEFKKRTPGRQAPA